MQTKKPRAGGAILREAFTQNVRLVAAPDADHRSPVNTLPSDCGSDWEHVVTGVTTPSHYAGPPGILILSGPGTLLLGTADLQWALHHWSQSVFVAPAR